MSVVAVRNGIIAADTRGSLGETKFRSRKLVRQSDVAIGHVGRQADGDTFAEWYFAGHNLDALPKFHNRDGQNPAIDFTAFVLTPDGWEYWDDWFVVNRDMGRHNPFMAIGSGAEAAMGAMHMGATAVEAVEAACAVTKGCELPVEHEAIS